MTLREMADEMLRLMMLEVEKKHGGAPALLLFRIGDSEPMIQPAPESFGDILESGVAKDKWFAFVRSLCQASAARPGLQGITAFGICTEAWHGEATDKGERLMAEHPEIWKEKTDKGFATLLSEGYIRRSETVCATVQDRENVVVAWRAFARAAQRFNWISDTQVTEVPQSGFGGRGKMFGDLREENLG